MGVPAHICAVGLYCKAPRSHLRHARAALATKPCFQEIQTRTTRKSSPQGVTIPNAQSHINFFGENAAIGRQRILFAIENAARSQLDKYDKIVCKT